ncbi:MAG: TRAP transporter large permease [Proteobacteria bacterium]|nr:TRAP transporter large permease [Pseudomonadota bacterium]
MTPFIFAIKLLLAVPVALVLSLTAAWYIWESGNTILYDSFAQKMFAGIENYGILAIPLFMLTGELMNEGGMTTRLIKAARVFVGGFRGGLVYINLLTNMFMAAIIGSAAAQISIMSRTMVPEMEKEGYDRGFAAATTAAGGLLAPMIPPSMMFVIYGVLAQISIGDMFIAGILPGLLLTIIFAIVIAVIGLIQPFPKSNWLSLRLAGSALLSCVPAVLIPTAIIGGILFGFMTPTESAAIASLIAFFVGWLVYKELRLKNLAALFRRTAINASMIIFMIAAANVFGWVIIYEALPQKLASLITALTDDAFVFLLIVTLILLVVGMLIDGIAAVILITPILLPIALDVYGISPFQFGVVVCLNLVLGLLTPPIGVGLYISSAISETPMDRILKSLWPFLLAVVLTLILLCYFPFLSIGLL